MARAALARVVDRAKARTAVALVVVVRVPAVAVRAAVVVAEAAVASNASSHTSISIDEPGSRARLVSHHHIQTAPQILADSDHDEERNQTYLNTAA